MSTHYKSPSYKVNLAGDRPSSIRLFWYFEHHLKLTINRHTLRDHLFLSSNYNLEHQQQAQFFLSDEMNTSKSAVNS
ncbi:hypothetical protein [Rodentibacter caecimuris]|uniref:hypothetical protein n=1 Tax=Rodentibacter caecimuris TaxID=1796644 RepID=UPI002590B482|nr:hypothetical protein [Rodentibacter heylii]